MKKLKKITEVRIDEVHEIEEKQHFENLKIVEILKC